MKFSFIATANGDVIDAEDVDFLSGELELCKIVKRVKATTVALNGCGYIPDGIYSVYKITTSSKEKLINNLNNLTSQSSSPATLRNYFELLDIIEDGYFSALVIY